MLITHPFILSIMTNMIQKFTLSTNLLNNKQSINPLLQWLFFLNKMIMPRIINFSKNGILIKLNLRLNFKNYSKRMFLIPIITKPKHSLHLASKLLIGTLLNNLSLSPKMIQLILSKCILHLSKSTEKIKNKKWILKKNNFHLP